MKLTKISKKQVTTKKGLGYFEIYEKYFNKIRFKKLKILEIGIENGGSLRTWKKYFPNSKIVGLDIKKMNFVIKNVDLIEGDQSSTKVLNQIIKTNTQEFVLCITLIFSMLNFFFIFNLFNKRKITREHNEDFALIIISIIFTLILVLLINDLGIFKALISVVSSISNSGLTLYEPQKNISLYFLLITIIGGSIISNSSGIKFMRIYILVKTTKSEILKLVRPNNIFNQNPFGIKM